MKLNRKNLVKMIQSVMNESYGNLGPDEPTERISKMQVMSKDRFVKEQSVDWFHEFEAADQGEMEIIQEILKDAYDEIGHALELDNTGLYESRRRWGRNSRELISYATNLLLYNPNHHGGMSIHPIKKESDGDYMRFFIDKDGREIEIFVNQHGAKVFRMGKAVDTGEQVDLVPHDTSGNIRYGGRGHISLK
jgi:hypothetical protein